MLTILGFFGKGMKILLSLVGADKTIAQTQIVSEGFTVGTVTQSDSADAAQLSNHNKVITQTPSALILIDYETPINITWRNFSFSPYSFTPIAPYSFTPATPYSFTPQYSFTPYAFTPYAFTPYAFTPMAASQYISYAYCDNNGQLNGYSGLDISFDGYTTTTQACNEKRAALELYGATNFVCQAGTVNSPLYTQMGVSCTPAYSFTPMAAYSFTPAAAYSFTPQTPATVAYYAYCGNTSAGYTAGQVLTGQDTLTCTQAYQQLVSFGEISGGWICKTTPLTGNEVGYPTFASCGGTVYSFTPMATYSFTPAAAYSFTPYAFTPAAYSFTPYAFTPAAYSFTPYAFTPAAYSFTPTSSNNNCVGTKPYPYCLCTASTPNSSWTC